MNDWTLASGRWLAKIMPRMLLALQAAALAHAADQGPMTPASAHHETQDRVAMAESLDGEIAKVDARLIKQRPVLLAHLKWLKSTGYLCRRTKTDIEREIAKVQVNMGELQRMRQSRHLDRVHARRIAYALGMEADALAKQATRLDEAAAPSAHEVDATGAEVENAARKGQQAVQILSTMSETLHELAKAIMANLERGN